MPGAQVRSPRRRRCRLTAGVAAGALGIAASLGFVHGVAADRAAGPRVADGAQVAAALAPSAASSATATVTAPATSPATGSSGRLEGPVIPVVPARSAVGRAVPHPVHLTVPSVHIDVPVVPTGVDTDGTMKIPASGEVAGWYRYGPAPAARSGTVVLASHVDTLKGLGEFSRLRELRRGAAVDVRDSSGATAQYTVRSVVLIPKSTIPLQKIFVPDGERRLVLMTCGGSWNAAVGHYRDNVVVVATPDA